MDIIKNCLKRPIIIYSLIILILFSGLLALFKIPIQLTPDVRKPVIEITTNWQGGSPSEVEREIVIKQEDVLKSVKGVERIRSNANDKKSEIKLEFSSTKNFQTSLLMASNALDRVRGMPEEIMKPTIETSGSGNTRGTAMVDTKLDGSGVHRTLQVGDDYRAQEHPNGSAQTITTTALRINKA